MPKQTTSKPKSAPPATKTTKDLVAIKEETADLVLKKVQVFQRDGELHLPANYSAANALKSAWLILQDVKDKDKNPALDICSRHSIANALLDMVVQGLNPAKQQCYFIVYGRQLTLQRSYFGTKAVALRVDDSLEDIYAEAIYKGDQLEYRIERGQRIIENHTQKFDNIVNSNIVGAYAVAVKKDGGVKRSEIMTIDQLKQAWKQSKMYPVTDKGDLKDNSTHAKFTEEMAKKTVTNRLAKHIINVSTDSSLVLDAVRRSDDETAAAEAQDEVEKYGNQGDIIDIGPGLKKENPLKTQETADHIATGEPPDLSFEGQDKNEPMSEEEKAEIMREEQEQSKSNKLRPDF